MSELIKVEAAPPSAPNETKLVVDDTTAGYVSRGLKMGIRQAIIYGGGMVAAHGIIPNGLLGSGTADAIAGVTAAAIMIAWGQYKEVHRTSKLVMFVDGVSNAIGEALSKRKSL